MPMKRHQQEQPQPNHGDGGRASALAPTSVSTANAAAQEPPLQFDSNMDWPASNEARDPLSFPTAHIAPCARITTRIYHPPHLTQAGLISGAAGGAAGGAGGMYAQQAQQGRVETVRDVLVEIAGPSRDEMGRPIIPTPQPPAQPVQNQRQQQRQRQQQIVAQRIGGRTTINNNNSAGAATAIDADDGAGFTGAGGFLLGGMANAVSVTGGHNSGSNLMAGANMGGAAGSSGAAATGGGGGGGGMGDDDDSMSSGWSTSDSEMSYDNNGTAGQGGGPTRPNPAFGGGGGGGAASTGASHHHHHQEYQPPQRAYLLQRTLREAIYGRVRYGIVLKRRQLPPDYDASTSSQPMAEWEVTNERCAVKEMSWQHIRKERNRLAEDPIKEVSAMQYLKRYLAQCIHGSPTSLDSSDAMLSTHIMLPLDLLSDDRYLYSVMPYCDGGELFDRLDQRQKFSEDEARYWMHQILDGVDNLQRAGICHRDMSLENLLVHKDRICLVIDMGMCLRIPYEGGKEDASDLFDAACGGNGDEDGDCHDDSKRPRALSTGTDLRKSFMSMDLDNGAGGRAGGADANGTMDAGNEKKCCLDIRQRKRYLMKPQGTCGKWHYMTSASSRDTLVEFPCFFRFLLCIFVPNLTRCVTSSPFFLSNQQEIMKNRDPFDGHAIDMWALGVILFLMLTGFPPWERACRTDERYKYMSAGYLVQMLTEWDLGLSPDAMDLLQRMVWIDPRDRLSLRQVRNHPWMLAK